MVSYVGESHKQLSGCADTFHSKEYTNFLRVPGKFGLWLSVGLDGHLVHWLLAIGVSGWEFYC